MGRSLCWCSGLPRVPMWSCVGVCFVLKGGAACLGPARPACRAAAHSVCAKHQPARKMQSHRITQGTPSCIVAEFFHVEQGLSDPCGKRLAPSCGARAAGRARWPRSRQLRAAEASWQDAGWTSGRSICRPQWFGGGSGVTYRPRVEPVQEQSCNPALGHRRDCERVDSPLAAPGLQMRRRPTAGRHTAHARATTDRRTQLRFLRL